MQTDARLAEVVGSLALAAELGMGLSQEHALRACLLAVALGERLGLTEAQLAETYYVGLLRWIGCTSHAHELAGWFDDEIEAHRRTATLDFGRPAELLADLLRHAGRGRGPVARVRTVAGAVAGGRAAVAELFASSCEVAEALARRLGCPDGVRAALDQVFERWDGRGWPRGLAGAEIAVSARIAGVAHDAVAFAAVAAPGDAVAAARARGGRGLDPAIAALLDPPLLAAAPPGAWDAVLAAEPGPRPRLAGAALDEALTTMAEFADLKTPWTAGHSTGVAVLAEAAARHAGLPDADAELLRRAALVHDLGRTGVPNGIWDKPGPLTDGEWERVRLHPYLTERVLARSPALAPLGAVAGRHHERLDGSGYHRGCEGRELPPSARLLAAADAFHAMTEHRPHRPPLAPAVAAAELRAGARAGRLDGEAVEAVLAAAGQRPRRRAERAHGLSPREVQVLRLLASGRSNREVAAVLVISERTVKRHVENIYAKLGVRTRAAAALFAMRRGLLG